MELHTMEDITTLIYWLNNKAGKLRRGMGAEDKNRGLYTVDGSLHPRQDL
jgi:hypothetical protein